MSRVFDAVGRDTAILPGLQAILAEQERQAPLPEATGPSVSAIAQEAISTGSGTAAAPALEQAAPLVDSCIRTLPLCIEEGAPLLPFEDSSWLAGEQYRIIRTRIIQHPAQPQVILITSSGPLDGKTVTAVNLAGALALKNESKTLLIDGDLRRGAMHATLGFPNAPGLREVLHGDCALEQALIRTEQLPNLYMLPCGDNRRHASELLDSENWRTTMRAIRNQFAYVVLDSPPLAAVADYDLLAEVSDGMVLVVRPDHSSRKMVMQAIKAIPKAKMLGVVLNCAEDWFLARSYDYGSYYQR